MIVGLSILSQQSYGEGMMTHPYTPMCSESFSGNTHYEVCRDYDDNIWQKNSTGVGNKTYLYGVDVLGNRWSGVREVKGKKSKTSYYDKQGKLIATRECLTLNCKDELIKHYQMYGVLDVGPNSKS